MQFGGARSHRVAFLSLLVWTATTVASVVPGSAPRDGAGAQADAAPAPRPPLDALVLASAPLAYWPLQDTSPQVVQDRLGAHPGTGHGQLRVGQVGPGTTGTSAGFDGVTAEITAASAALAPEATAVTAWLRTPRQALGNFGMVIETGGLTLGIAAGRLVATTCAAPTSCQQLVSAPDVTDGAWHQVALSVGNGQATLFVDGGRTAVTASTGAAAPPPDGLVRIGRRFRGNLGNVALFSAPLTADAVAAQFAAGACPQAAGTLPAPTGATTSLPALPLHTSGRWILGATGKRVKLAGVNWYGAESLDHAPSGLQCQSADAIAARIAAGGFNVVRLAWSTDAWDRAAPAVPPIAVAGDPQLRGGNARQVFDAVIAALGRHGLMVVLDNHVGRADWCCTNTDGNALWWEYYDSAHPPRWQRRTASGKLRLFRQSQARWLLAWHVLARRYSPSGSHPQPNVVGADLRNEPRDDRTLGLHVTWRSGHVAPWLDWARAAQTAGNAVLRVNPRLLIVVEGTSYATDLRGAGVRPIRLAVPHRLVYSAHDYAWFHGSPGRVRDELGAAWGWLLIQHRSWTTPVWVGEYGSCHPDDLNCGSNAWFAAVRQYLADGDIDWAYWAVNGTSESGGTEPTTCPATPRAPGCVDGYGVFDPTWSGDASPALTADLRALQPATQSP